MPRFLDFLRRSSERVMRRVLVSILPRRRRAAPCAGLRRRRQSEPAHPARATVERVVDGDTVDLRFASGRERVRLLGIDTPETVKPNTPVQCFGPEASARAKALLPHGHGGAGRTRRRGS